MKAFVAIVSLIVLVGCKKHTDTTFNIVEEVAPLRIETFSNTEVPVYNFDGFEKLLSVSDDKTYIINFWATWCKPCVEELPHFETIAKQYKSKDVEVILVSLDFPNKVESALIPFIEKHNLESTVVLLDDPKQNTWIPKVDESWSGAIPATVIISKNKRSFYEKSFTFIELEKELKAFITN
ncbi:TlpA disulfide reductase family protein [Joostella sp. CR20]|uniref:TlpA disulfide reductase family protein n=1 Tax=Joostella sp. CR20 TaxID=2804312 RepID=UPI00313C07DE